MRITIDTDILKKYNITELEFSIILYYLFKGTGIPNNDICNTLWERNYLVKVLDGYELNPHSKEEIESWLAESALVKANKSVDYSSLADSLRALFPTGKKEGTIFYWRDSTKIISQKLAVFFKKYGDFSDENIIEATKRYIASFNGNYQYMQLLKYFISKKDKITGEESSELLSYLTNKNQKDNNNDWNATLV